MFVVIWLLALVVYCNGGSILVHWGEPQGSTAPFPCERSFASANVSIQAGLSHYTTLHHLFLSNDITGEECLYSSGATGLQGAPWALYPFPTAENDLSFDCFNLSGINETLNDIWITDYMAIAISQSYLPWISIIQSFPSPTFSMQVSSGFEFLPSFLSLYTNSTQSHFIQIKCHHSLCGMLSQYSYQLYLGGYAEVSFNANFNIAYSPGGSFLFDTPLTIAGASPGNIIFYEVRIDVIFIALSNNSAFILEAATNSVLFGPYDLESIANVTSPMISYGAMTQNAVFVIAISTSPTLTVTPLIWLSTPNNSATSSFEIDHNALAIIEHEQGLGSVISQVHSTDISLHMLFSSGAIYSMYLGTQDTPCPGFITLSPTCPYQSWVQGYWGKSIPLSHYVIDALTGTYAIAHAEVTSSKKKDDLTTSSTETEKESTTIEETKDGFSEKSKRADLPPLNSILLDDIPTTTQTAIPYVWGALGLSSGYGINPSLSMTDFLLPSPSDFRSIPTRNVTKVVVSSYAGLAVTTDGFLLVTGSPLDGDNTYYPSSEMTAPTTSWIPVPSSTFSIPSAANPSVIDVAVGSVDCYALTSTGTVFQWGQRSQWASGTVLQLASWPGQFTAPSPLDLARIYASDLTAAAVTTTGELYLWGNLTSSLVNFNAPVLISGIPPISISTSQYPSDLFAIGEDCAIYGSNVNNLTFLALGRNLPNCASPAIFVWGYMCFIPSNYSDTVRAVAIAGSIWNADIFAIVLGETGLYGLGTVPHWGITSGYSVHTEVANLTFPGMPPISEIASISIQNRLLYILTNNGSLYGVPTDPSNLKYGTPVSMIQIGDDDIEWLGISSFSTSTVDSIPIPHVGVARPRTNPIVPDPWNPYTPQPLIFNDSVPYQAVFSSYTPSTFLLAEIPASYNPYLRTVPSGHPLETAPPSGVSFFGPFGLIQDGNLGAGPRLIRFSDTDSPKVLHPQFSPSYIDLSNLTGLNFVFFSGFRDISSRFLGMTDDWQMLEFDFDLSSAAPVSDPTYSATHLLTTSYLNITNLGLALYAPDKSTPPLIGHLFPTRALFSSLDHTLVVNPFVVQGNDGSYWAGVFPSVSTEFCISNETLLGPLSLCKTLFNTSLPNGFAVAPLDFSNVTSFTGLADVQIAGYYATALTNDGQVLNWGDFARLPWLTHLPSVLPFPNSTGLFFTHIATYLSLTGWFAVRSDNAVFAWGVTTSLPIPELWPNHLSEFSAPTEVTLLPRQPIRSIKCATACFVVYQSGEIWSWGFAASQLLGRPINPAQATNPASLVFQLDLIPAPGFVNTFPNPSRTVIDLYTGHNSILLRASIAVACLTPAPSPLFTCIQGVWTEIGNVIIGGPSNNNSITITGPSQVIGNVTIFPGTTVIFANPPLNSSVPLLNVSGCANVSGTLEISFDPATWQNVRSNLTSSVLLESSCGYNVSSLAANVATPPDCQQTSASLQSQQTETGRQQLLALFNVDSSSCSSSSIWWIILVAVVGAVLIFVIIGALTWRISRSRAEEEGMKALNQESR